MSSIKETLANLQPYVTGVRFVENYPIVDVIFKDNWAIVPSKIISFERGDKDKNYYMFYSDKPDIGFDEILDYVKSIINLNVERELKYELLKVKVDELKVIFKEKSLKELEGLQYTFPGEQLMPTVMGEDDLLKVEFDLTTESPKKSEEEVIKKPEVNTKKQTKKNSVKVVPVNNVKTKKEQPTEADLKIKPGEPEYIKEIDGEFQKFNLSSEVELPPKKNGKVIIEEPEIIVKTTCKCGPDEYCPICAADKGF